jgi:hypothetical protein
MSEVPEKETYLGCGLGALSFFAGWVFRGLMVTTLPLLLHGLSDQTTRPSTSQRNTGVCAKDRTGNNRGNTRRRDFFMKRLERKYDHDYTLYSVFFFTSP